MTGSRKILIVGVAATAAALADLGSAICESIKLPDRTTRPDIPTVDPFDDDDPAPIAPYAGRAIRSKDWESRNNPHRKRKK